METILTLSVAQVVLLIVTVYLKVEVAHRHVFKTMFLTQELKDN